jgi:hypothetical protein
MSCNVVGRVLGSTLVVGVAVGAFVAAPPHASAVGQYRRWAGDKTYTCQSVGAAVGVTLSDQNIEVAGLAPGAEFTLGYVLDGVATIDGPYPAEANGPHNYGSFVQTAASYPFTFEFVITTLLGGEPVYTSSLSVTCTGDATGTVSPVDVETPPADTPYRRWRLPKTYACQTTATGVMVLLSDQIVELHALPAGAQFSIVYIRNGVAEIDGPYPVEASDGLRTYGAFAETFAAYPFTFDFQLTTIIGGNVVYTSTLHLPCTGDTEGLLPATVTNVGPIPPPTTSTTTTTTTTTTIEPTTTTAPAVTTTSSVAAVTTSSTPAATTTSLVASEPIVVGDFFPTATVSATLPRTGQFRWRVDDHRGRRRGARAGRDAGRDDATHRDPLTDQLRASALFDAEQGAGAGECDRLATGEVRAVAGAQRAEIAAEAQQQLASGRGVVERAGELDAPEPEGRVRCVVRDPAARVVAGGEHGIREWADVEHGQQFLDVDVLRRQPTADHVVARSHDLDAHTVDVGVEVAGFEEDGFAGRERDAVEQEGDGDRRVAGVLPGERGDEHRLRREVFAAGTDRRVRVEDPAVEVGDGAGEARSGEMVGEVIGAEAAQHELGVRERTEAAQRVERRERDEHLGLRERVAVDAFRCIDRDARGVLPLEPASEQPQLVGLACRAARRSRPRPRDSRGLGEHRACGFIDLGDEHAAHRAERRVEVEPLDVPAELLDAVDLAAALHLDRHHLAGGRRGTRGRSGRSRSGTRGARA